MIFRAFLFAILLMPAWANAQSTTYRFSPVNQWDINKTAAYWNPIIRYVSDKSGVKLELKIGRTSADTTAYVLARRELKQRVRVSVRAHDGYGRALATVWLPDGREVPDD